MAFVPYVAHLRMTVYKSRGQHLQLSFNKTKVHLKRLSNVDESKRLWSLIGGNYYLNQESFFMIFLCKTFQHI